MIPAGLALLGGAACLLLGFSFGVMVMAACVAADRADDGEGLE